MTYRLYGIGWWIIGGLLLLGGASYMKDHGGITGVPGLAPVPWEQIDATTYKKDCGAGQPKYSAIGDKDGQVLYFERPCSDPPPEDKR